MDDYIKREDAKRVLNKGLSYMRAFGVNRCLTMIDEVPSSDVVEVVRCKDCKHRDVENGFCEGRGWPMQLVPDDGFCDKGKRSEE